MNQDLHNVTTNATDELRDDQLTEEELSRVVGGSASVTLYKSCVTGKHIPAAKITC